MSDTCGRTPTSVASAVPFFLSMNSALPGDLHTEVPTPLTYSVAVPCSASVWLQMEHPLLGCGAPCCLSAKIPGGEAAGASVTEVGAGGEIVQ